MLAQLNAQIIYVKKGANGNGTSWKNASGDLNQALDQAKKGTEIWVAKGTYIPSQTDRNVSFTISSGVAVYGGFEGNETQLNQRNYKLNITILSGEIGTTFRDDNSYSVVYISNSDNNTILDGFTISNGAATEKKDGRTRGGGGLYNDGQESVSNPTIQNCIFKNNYGRDGAAIYNNGNNGQANAHIINCQFIKNIADLDGGAIFNDGRAGGMSNPIISECTFLNNTGNFGGAILNYGLQGESSPTISRCQFTENKAYIKGGGVYNIDVEGIANPTLLECSFNENIAKTGNSVYTYGEEEFRKRNLKTKQIRNL